MIIYKVTNKINGKSYIGQTVRTLEVRKSGHLCDTFHRNSNFVIHRALRKHGKENFEWKVIDDTVKTIEELNEKEKHYIEKYDTFMDNGNGYNMTTGGENALHSEKTCEKIRKALTGKERSKDHCKNISKNNARYWKGKKRSEETCKKMRKNSARYWKGKKHTEKTCKKMRKAHQGEKNYFAKLTEKEVLAIRTEYKENVYGEYARIARKYSVGENSIRDIILRKTWKHI